MTYTATQFAAHLERRGATVQISEAINGHDWVDARYGDHSVTATFRLDSGRFNDARLWDGSKDGKHLRTLKAVVDALNLPGERVPAGKAGSR